MLTLFIILTLFAHSETMIVLIKHNNTHRKYKHNKYIQQLSNIYSNQINSINLHTLSFDNASHDDKLSRISHNSITLCHELLVYRLCLIGFYSNFIQ